MRHSLVVSILALAACASTPAMNETALTGKRWVAEAAEVAAGERPRLEFQADGRLAGYSGCNNVGGRWKMEGGEVKLSGLIATKRGCIGPGGDLEKRFFAAVNEKSTVSLQGGKLVVQGTSERLVFENRG
jgi:heat shock protein HslJ